MATLTTEERKKYLDSMTPAELQSYTIGNITQRALAALVGQGSPTDPTAPVPVEVDPRLLVTNKNNVNSSLPTITSSHTSPSVDTRNNTLKNLSPSVDASNSNQPVVADLQSRPDLMKMTLSQLKASVAPSGTPSINGMPISIPSGQQSNQNNVWTKNQNGSYSGNNLDVSFDSSVPQSTRDAFMKVPNTAPGATWEDMNRQRMGPAASEAWRFQGGSSSPIKTIEPPSYITVEQAREKGIGRKLLSSLNDRMEKDYHAQLAAAGQENDTATRKEIANNELNSQLPLKQAQGAYYNAQTKDLPLAGLAQRELQNAQAEELRSKAEEGNYIKVKQDVPYGLPDLVTGNQQTRSVERLYDRKLRKYIDDSMIQTPNIASSLTTEQRNKAVAYAKANPNIDKAIILQKIVNGEI